MNPTLALILCPIITGLASVLWSKLVGVHPIWSMSANVLAYSINLLILIHFRDHFPATIALGKLDFGLTFAFATITSAMTTFLWIFALRGSSLSAVAFVEIGYPFFILLFSMFLIGNVKMNVYHIVGGMIITLGTGLVVYGNLKLHK